MSNEIIVITGARGTGKSTLAATYLQPDRIEGAYIHDSENSMNHIRANIQGARLDFGHYVDLKARFSDLPSDDDLLDRLNAGRLPWVGDSRIQNSLAEYYEYVLSDLAENLEHGRYKLYVHDTLEKFEAGMAAWVELDKKRAGVTTTAYGRLWTDGVYPLYENFLASIFGRGVETIILTSHLKNVWEGNRPVVGKVAPSGKKLLYRVSSLFLWLVNDKRNSDGAPAALVLKERMGRLTIQNNRWYPKCMLPQRIPHCTWTDVDRYLEIGADLANPPDNEVMSKAEQEMISELLSDEQMKLMILDAERELAEARQSGLLMPAGQVAVFQKSEQPEGSDLKSRMLTLSTEGKSMQEIAEEVRKPLPIVRKILAEAP